MVAYEYSKAAIYGIAQGAELDPTLAPITPAQDAFFPARNPLRKAVHNDLIFVQHYGFDTIAE
jgi:hypothetical protein